MLCGQRGHARCAPQHIDSPSCQAKQFAAYLVPVPFRLRLELVIWLVMKAQEMMEVVTIGEAADLIRISRRHLQKLMADGDGPPTIQLGRRKIIRLEALRHWLMNREADHAASR